VPAKTARGTEDGDHYDSHRSRFGKGQNSELDADDAVHDEWPPTVGGIGGEPREREQITPCKNTYTPKNRTSTSSVLLGQMSATAPQATETTPLLTGAHQLPVTSENTAFFLRVQRGTLPASSSSSTPPAEDAARLLR
jgi:hypothetical protein